ncbi:MAG TPA: hypothetical protein VH309_10240 [Elusimicrobiota bacterium]|jgi:hypothetical protein|nr:hypothetical protein [Elusimicrobiota bacterium]
MKRSILPLALALPLFAAATASAQLASIRFVAPVNPVAGLPRLLPSPMTGPLAGSGITLPNLVPALTPSLSLAAAAAPASAYLPSPSLPAREGRIPASPAQPSRDGVVNPLRRVMPGVVIRFGQTAPAKGGAVQPDRSKENLDQAFDGEGAPSKPVVERQPVSSGRHISLPEWDLERELGL